MSAPQRGQTPSRRRWGMTSPVWTPPRSIARRVAARMSRRTRSSSSSSRPPAGRRVVDHDAPGHADYTSLYLFALVRYPHRLALAVGLREPVADERVAQLTGSVGTADVGVGVVDVHDLTAQPALGDQGARGLD